LASSNPAFEKHLPTCVEDFVCVCVLQEASVGGAMTVVLIVIVIGALCAVGYYRNKMLEAQIRLGVRGSSIGTSHVELGVCDGNNEEPVRSPQVGYNHVRTSGPPRMEIEEETMPLGGGASV